MSVSLVAPTCVLFQYRRREEEGMGAVAACLYTEEKSWLSSQDRIHSHPFSPHR